MKTNPFVSCIMPTANRETFIPQSIQYFMRQDYPSKELIIVDDGDISIAHLVPALPGVKYIRLDTGNNTIGAKRNIACKHASGDIIVHWDDDDWYAPDWVSAQVHTLRHTNAAICGLDQLYFYAPRDNRSWIYKYPSASKPWVGGATMAYLRSLWERYQFRNLQVGEDNDFVWYSGGVVRSSGYLNGFVSLLHDRNTSPKHISDARWHSCPVKNVKDILREDDPVLRK
ncbi:glycosyltransferase family 2 protein [Chitinophagaceae bacterium MMS25-I14]